MTTNIEQANSTIRTPTTEYIESINLLRGVAAFLVVCEHIVGRTPYAIFNQYFGWLDNLGIYGVIIFFVISGFILPYSLGDKYQLRGYGQFLLRRFVRIQPVYFVSIAVSITFTAILTRIAPNAIPFVIDFKILLLHSLYLIPFTQEPWLQGVYWTLAIEFQFYIVIGILYPWFRSISAKSVIYLCLIPISLSLIAFSYSFVESLQLVKYLPYFSLGIFCSLQYKRKISKTLLIAVIFVLSTILLILGTNIYELFVGATTFFIILLWRSNPFANNPLGRLILFFSTISYSWYATHQTFAGAGESLAKFILKLNSFPSQLLIVNLVPIFIFLVSIVFAYIIHLLVEIPSHKLARKIKYK